MQDSLPAMPQGGYYVVEVTGGFVDNTFNGNRIDLTGKSSVGISLNGTDYGTLITNNQFIGGTSGSPVFSGRRSKSPASTVGSAASSGWASASAELDNSSGPWHCNRG